MRPTAQVLALCRFTSIHEQIRNKTMDTLTCMSSEPFDLQVNYIIEFLSTFVLRSFHERRLSLQYKRTRKAGSGSGSSSSCPSECPDKCLGIFPRRGRIFDFPKSQKPKASPLALSPASAPHQPLHDFTPKVYLQFLTQSQDLRTQRRASEVHIIQASDTSMLGEYT